MSQRTGNRIHAILKCRAKSIRTVVFENAGLMPTLARCLDDPAVICFFNFNLRHKLLALATTFYFVLEFIQLPSPPGITGRM
jgi:hypothetical protein